MGSSVSNCAKIKNLTIKDRKIVWVLWIRLSCSQKGTKYTIDVDVRFSKRNTNYRGVNKPTYSPYLFNPQSFPTSGSISRKHLLGANTTFFPHFPRHTLKDMWAKQVKCYTVDRYSFQCVVREVTFHIVAIFHSIHNRHI